MWRGQSRVCWEGSERLVKSGCVCASGCRTDVGGCVVGCTGSLMKGHACIMKLPQHRQWGVAGVAAGSLSVDERAASAAWRMGGGAKGELSCMAWCAAWAMWLA